MSVTKLKVKIKSLAAEATFIRHEERALVWIKNPANPCGPRVRVLRNPRGTTEGDQLYSHRTIDVRAEQRVTLLAYGFLRGRLYRAVEPPCKCVSSHACHHSAPHWARVVDMVSKYGYLPKQRAADSVAAWRGGAAPGQTRTLTAHHKFVQWAGLHATCPALLGS